MSQAFNRQDFEYGLTLAATLSLLMARSPGADNSPQAQAEKDGQTGLRYVSGVAMFANKILMNLFNEETIEHLHTLYINPESEKYKLENIVQQAPEKMIVHFFTDNYTDREVFDRALLVNQFCIAAAAMKAQDAGQRAAGSIAVRYLGVARDLLSDAFDRGDIPKELILFTALNLGESIAHIDNDDVEERDMLRKPFDDYIKIHKVADFKDQIEFGSQESSERIKNRAHTLWANHKYNAQWKPPGVN